MSVAIQFTSLLNYSKRLAMAVAMVVIFSPLAHSQCSPNASASLVLTLGYTIGGGTNATGVAYNPNMNLYYTGIAGNPGFPMETFNTGGTSLYNTNTGFDIRGMWWNPNLNQLESNGYNNRGIWSFNLNGSGYALNTGTQIHTGYNQPNTQSVGDYNCVDNEIIYHNSGTIQRRDRATNALITNFSITGLPVGTGNLNYNTIYYTDCPGHEYGVLDYINKRVYFIDKATGAYVGQSALPGSAVTNNAFRASWANGLAWVYSTGTRTWYGYDVITNGGAPCTTILPATSLLFEAERVGGAVELKWSTEAELSTDFFTLEHSADGENWEHLATLDAAGNSSTEKNYRKWDRHPVLGDNHYRLTLTDLNGVVQHTGIQIVNFNRSQLAGIDIYPNPATTQLTIEGSSEEIEDVLIYDLLGSQVLAPVIERQEGKIRFDVSGLASGTYVVKTPGASEKIVVRNGDL